MVYDWDTEVDVLVAGSGAAGLTAAAAASERGMRTLVVESADRWGGTTNLSGGGLWLPANPLMAQHGISDSVDEALAYLQATVGDDAGPAASAERRRAFVHAVPDVFRFLQRHGVRFALARDHPDHYPDRPGGKVGRAVEVEPFDTKALGAWFRRSRSAETLPAPLRTDDMWLLSRAWSSPSGLLRGAQFLARTAGGIARGQRLYGLGTALVSSLMTIVRRQGTQVLLSTPLTGLVMENGAVIGASVMHPDGSTGRIRARGGVVLAAGGFARNRAWRERYHDIPGFSSAADGDQGSAIRIGDSVGAQLSLMEEAWWVPSVRSADPDGRPTVVVAERSFPFSIVVDSRGERYTNESASDIDVGHAMLQRHSPVPSVPSWLILDVRHRRRYLFGALMQGTKQLREAGIVHKAQTIEELATALGMQPARLRATVERFNGFARQGVDHDFSRGASAYDNYYGDPRVRPNPNLGTIEQAPFTAVQLVPGDLGTKGGLVTDADARVLDTAGTAIEGLYAAGHVTASVTGRSDPGLGSSIAPAVIFGYLGARHAAARRPDAALLR